MLRLKHPEDFIRKCLSDRLNILKVQNNHPESIEPIHETPGLRPRDKTVIAIL
jgi:hypothetical protein